MEFIGKYRIIKRLGGGGFGDVYLGHDEVMQRDMAIKVFNPKNKNLLAFATSSDEEALQVLRERFLREARILARLEDSPHIIHVIEFGQLEDGCPWYAMPYVPHSLAGELGRDVFDKRALEELPEAERPRALDLDTALGYLSQIIAGLASAHEAGLVHRDIKPSNILLTESGQIRIADFGIAKAPDGVHSDVSQRGIGSRNYMAPEQRESAKHVDARADVYALGVLAYRMITARLPSGRYADPNVHVPALGKALNETILAAMAADVDARPKDAGQLLRRWQVALKAREKEATPDTSEASTSTQVEPLLDSGVPDRLQPLVELVEKTLLEHGYPDPAQAEIAAMARILGLDESRQKALVDEIWKKSPQLSLVDNLHRMVVERARQTAVLEDAEFEDLVGAAELAGKDREWLLRQFAALLPRRPQPPKSPAPKSRPPVAEKKPEVRTVQVEPAVAMSVSTPPATAESSNWPMFAIALLAVAVVGILLFGDVFGSKPETGPAGENTAKSAGPAKHHTKTPGSIFRDGLKGGGEGPEMVVIPAGSFRMGDLSGGGDGDEKPVHEVRIARQYALGKYELTFAEYDRYAAAAGKPKPGDQGWGRGNRPLINVSWEDAQGYVKWLSAQTGKRYRLPSESEWEYAARAGTTTRYSWGDSISCANALYGYYSDNCGKHGSTDSVGSFPANPFGLHDMHGNVWEWVEDCWHKNYQGAPADGSAWTDGGDCAARVLRGGSWLIAPWDLRSALRFRRGRINRDDSYGFRVARDLP